MRENGVSTVSSYNTAGQQTAVNHQVGVTVLEGVGYNLDSMGRRTSITRARGLNDSGVHDAAGQVTSWSYDGWNVIDERTFNATGSLLERLRHTWGRDASGSLLGAAV